MDLLCNTNTIPVMPPDCYTVQLSSFCLYISPLSVTTCAAFCGICMWYCMWSCVWGMFDCSSLSAAYVFLLAPQITEQLFEQPKTRE